jgi:transposase
MDDGSSGATALLEMDGFVVLASIEEAGELFISVETTADVVGCASCGVRAVGHGRSVIQIRDQPAGGRPVRLIWRKRRWFCRDPDCSTKSFTETSEAIEGSLTARAAWEICRLIGEDGCSVAKSARDFGIGWACAMGCAIQSAMVSPWWRHRDASTVWWPSASTSTRCCAPTDSTTPST